MFNGDVISMPDKWEYPWYAAWDLAFHTLALALVDFDFAKEQLLLMLRSLYSHPNGQIPAYEWNFSDVNPPVHAWATLFLYKVERDLGRDDIAFLERSFQGLMLNFNWWVNRKDPQGRNVFAGGFLGLDNIGVFDRSAPLPTGGSLEQADGTAWMAFYCQNMLEIALILAEARRAYEDDAFKFLAALHVDRLRDGPHRRAPRRDVGRGGRLLLRRAAPARRLGDPRLKVRSMVGLLPLAPRTVFEPELARRAPEADGADRAVPRAPSRGGRQVAPTERATSARAPAAAVAAPEEGGSSACSATCSTRTSSSPYGIRSLSRYHRDHPFVFHVGGHARTGPTCRRSRTPGCSAATRTGAGPIWMPVNGLIVRGLLNLYAFYGDDFTVECPTGSGNRMTLFEVAREISPG